MGEGYSITSDVWSLGITLHEFAFLKYPFQPPPRNPIEAITCITQSPIPQMDDGEIKWSENIKDFMSKWSVLIDPPRLAGR
jgi:mitogen-activated protein kinase kinase